MADITDLISRLDHLARRGMAELSGAMAEEALALVRQDSPVRSGALRDHWTEKHTKGAFSLRNTEPYTAVEQTRRQIVPEGDLGKWTRPIERAADQVIRETLGDP